LADNHVSILRPDQTVCLPVYLSLFLNSPAGLAQSEKFQTGSSGQLELYGHDIARIVVFLPKNGKGNLDLKWQKKLAEKAIAAYHANIKARETVEKAKRMIECEIEKLFQIN
jgi:hypothetical protein